MAIGGDAAGLARLGLEVVVDEWPGEGPLGGLTTAVGWSPEPLVAGRGVRPAVARRRHRRRSRRCPCHRAAIVASVSSVDGWCNRCRASTDGTSVRQLDGSMDARPSGAEGGASSSVRSRSCPWATGGRCVTWTASPTCPAGTITPTSQVIGARKWTYRRSTWPSWPVVGSRCAHDRCAAPDEYESGHVPGAVLVPSRGPERSGRDPVRR